LRRKRLVREKKKSAKPKRNVNVVKRHVVSAI
jgi:hypothetical protein